MLVFCESTTAESRLLQLGHILDEFVGENSKQITQNDKLNGRREQGRRESTRAVDYQRLSQSYGFAVQLDLALSEKEVGEFLTEVRSRGSRMRV